MNVPQERLLILQNLCRVNIVLQDIKQTSTNKVVQSVPMEDIQMRQQDLSVNHVQKEHMQVITLLNVHIVQQEQKFHKIKIDVWNVCLECTPLMKEVNVFHVLLTHSVIIIEVLNVNNVQLENQPMEKQDKHHVIVRKDVLIAQW